MKWSVESKLYIMPVPVIPNRTYSLNGYSTEMVEMKSDILNLDNKYFKFTFHSLDGEEWEVITNSVNKYAFQLVDFKLLIQKALPPRQLNRKNSIKGDLVVTYKKVKQTQMKLDCINVNDKIANEMKQNCNINKEYETNELIILFVKCLLKFSSSTNRINFIDLINEYFILNEESGKWFLKI